MRQFFGLFRVFKKKQTNSDNFLIQKDIKNINYLLIKKEKRLKEIENIDRRLTLIQKSTKTTIPQLQVVHENLRQKYKWYYNWHLKPYTNLTHWLVLFLFIFSSPLLYGYLAQKGTPVTKAGPTTSYDFPRWEWENPKPTGNVLNKIATCAQDGSIWVAGNTGTILKSTNSNTWSSQYTGVTNYLYGITCLSPSNIIAVGSAGMILQYDGQSWTQKNSGTVQDLTSVAAIGANVVAVGASGVVTFSADSGQSWIAEDSKVTNYLTNVIAVNATTFIAVGYGDMGVHHSSITISTDSGQHWTAEDSGTTDYLYGVAAIGTNVVAVGDNGTITASTNSGQTWETKTSQTAFDLYSVAAVGANTFVAVGVSGVITVSTDSGLTWGTRINGVPKTLSGVTAVGAGTAVAVGDSGTIVVSSDANFSIWASKSSGTTNYLNTVAATSATNVATVGLGGVVTVSTDSGLTWNNKTTPTTQNLAKVITAGANLVSVGATGTILVSSDSGQTWTSKGGSITAQNLNSVATFNGSTVVAVGNAGTILVSADSGLTWFAKTSGTTQNLNSVVAVSASVIVAVGNVDGNNGVITVSIDSGVNWATKSGGEGKHNLNSVTSLGNNVVAVGDTNALTVSADGGLTWTSKTGPASLYSVAAVGATTFVAVGSGGAITVSSDSGATWGTKASGTGTLRSVADSGTNVAAVSDDGMIAISTDSGLTWAAKDGGVGTYNLKSVIFTSATHIIVVGALGLTTASTDTGLTWHPGNSGTTNYLYSLAAIDASNIIAVGNSATILLYHSPANATATKVVVKLPGQSFADGVGVYGTPDAVKAGDSVSVTIYAVDDNNVLDRGNASTVGFTTTDPNDTNPPPIPLTQNNTCVQNRTDPSQSTCGQGTTTFVFHTAGAWTITASDTGHALNAGTSSDINVGAGSPTQLYFSNSSFSIFAGQVSGVLATGVRDQYGNNTTVLADTAVHLATTSSRGRFSTNQSTWSESGIDLIISAGAGSATFYYLDFNTGVQTLTATTSGLTTATAQINIVAGALSQSSFNISRNSITAGESLTATLNLKNVNGVVLSGKTVRVYSSRADENTGDDQVTDGSGNASFNVSSTKAGSFILIVYDQTDGSYVTIEQSVSVSPADLNAVNLSASTRSATAGNSLDLTATLVDRYGNTVTASNDTITFSSSDGQADFPKASHSFTGSDNGVFSETVTLKTAGNQTISATKSDDTLGKININVYPTSASADVSTLSSDKSRIDPNTDSATIIVKIMDAYKNPLAGKTVSLTSSGTDDSIAPDKITTADDGTTKFTFSSSVQGTSTIVAQDLTDNLVLSSKLQIKIAPATIIDKLKESPVAKALTKVLTPIAQTVAVISLIPLLLQLFQAIPSAAPLASSVFPVLFTTASVRRRKKPWGNVFDGLTGHPVDLAVVRLYDAKTKRLIDTSVTDFSGQFNFLIDAGTYYITVQKASYDFPVKISQFKASQISSRFGKETDIYLGDEFTIKDKSVSINLNIPLDPVLEKMTNKTKAKKAFKEGFDWFLIGVSYIAIPLMIIGAVVSALITIVHAGTLNYITNGAYLVLLSGFLVTQKIQRSRLGLVFDSKTREPIAEATVTIFDKEYNAIRQTQTTDKNGHFAILVQKGSYYLVIETKNYKFPSTILKTNRKEILYAGETINQKKTGFISVDVPMDRE